MSALPGEGNLSTRPGGSDEQKGTEWQVFALVIVLAIAATLALTLGRSSVSTTRAPAKGIAPAHAAQVGGGGQLQYKQLP